MRQLAKPSNLIRRERLVKALTSYTVVSSGGIPFPEDLWGKAWQARDLLENHWHEDGKGGAVTDETGCTNWKQKVHKEGNTVEPVSWGTIIWKHGHLKKKVRSWDEKENKALAVNTSYVHTSNLRQTQTCMSPMGAWWLNKWERQKHWTSIGVSHCWLPSIVSAQRVKNPSLLQLSLVILQRPWLSTSGSSGPRGSPGHCQLSHPVDSSLPWFAIDASLCTLEQTGRTHHPWR